MLKKALDTPNIVRDGRVSGERLDPLALLAVLATMTLVGIVSASLPARRALTVNPSKLLREE